MDFCHESFFCVQLVYFPYKSTSCIDHREVVLSRSCLLLFSEAGSFKRHLRTHSREKARSHFVFKGCYKSFSVSISLIFCSPPMNSFRILKREAPKNTYRREAICLKECSKSSSVSLKRQLGTKIRREAIYL